jgi:ribosomal protein L11 methyltransferase
MTIKITLTIAFPEARRISNFLERYFGDQGVAVSLDERSDGLWSVGAYFAAGASGEIVETLRDGLGADAFGVPVAVETLPDADWVAAGLKALRPVAAGRFVIHGSHDRGKLPAGRVYIEIDAAQAFGTGHHATTAGCLITLDRLLRGRRFLNPLDLGTGTGVLAIALAKTLRRPVLATDIDPVAVRIAAENAARNAVAHLVRAEVTAGIGHHAIRARAPFDLIVANILPEPLVRLAPQLSTLLAPNGSLVLSGLLPHHRERVVAAYGAQGVRLASARIFDGWSVLVLARGTRQGRHTCYAHRDRAKDAVCSRILSKPPIPRRAPSAPPRCAPSSRS